MINATINDSNLAGLRKMGAGADPHAVLYRHESRMLRAIKPKFSEFYSDLITQPFIKDLIEQGLLIQTEKSTASIEGYDLVLEHPCLTYITYPFEWTPSMFKRAAIAILKLNLELMQHGYCTQDAHPWNVLFDGEKPKFVDFTSIIKMPESGHWPALAEFNISCTNSLILMSKGLHSVVRALLRDTSSFPEPNIVNAFSSDVYGNSNQSSAIKDVEKIIELTSILLGKAKRRVLSRLSSTSRIPHSSQNSPCGREALIALIEEIERLNVEPKRAEWSNYYSNTGREIVYDGTTESLAVMRKSSAKYTTVDELLSQIKPKTVLDIGCNRGLFSQMAASHGAKVVGIDTDEYALDQMYLDSHKFNTSVIPLCVNAVSPAEAVYYKERPMPTVTERLESDCVLCMAVVHHLVFKRLKMDFPHIAQVLSSYTKNDLIVEFIPREDKHVQEWFDQGWLNEDFDWYTCDNFTNELRRYFSSIDVLESFPDPRLILHCRKS